MATDSPASPDYSPSSPDYNEIPSLQVPKLRIKLTGPHGPIVEGQQIAPDLASLINKQLNDARDTILLRRKTEKRVAIQEPIYNYVLPPPPMAPHIESNHPDVHSCDNCEVRPEERDVEAQRVNNAPEEREWVDEGEMRNGAGNGNGAMNGNNRNGGMNGDGFGGGNDRQEEDMESNHANAGDLDNGPERNEGDDGRDPYEGDFDIMMEVAAEEACKKILKERANGMGMMRPIQITMVNLGRRPYHHKKWRQPSPQFIPNGPAPPFPQNGPPPPFFPNGPPPGFRHGPPPPFVPNGLPFRHGPPPPFRQQAGGPRMPFYPPPAFWGPPPFAFPPRPFHLSFLY